MPVGAIRNFIRTQISPRVTSLSAKLGFANRLQFVRELQGLTCSSQGLLIDELHEKGILKTRFRDQVATTTDLQPYMLNGTLTMGQINSLGLPEIQTAQLYADQLQFMNTMTTGIKAGFETAGRALTAIDDSEVIPKLTFGLGAMAALGISGTLLFGGFPPAALALALTTTLGIAGSKFHDRLPPHSISALGSRWIAKTIPFSVIGLSAYLTDFVYESNMRIAGIFEAIGVKGTILFGLSLLWVINSSLRKHLREFRASYGGQLDPGSYKGMSTLVAASVYSITADAHYLGARMLLLGAASMYLFIKVHAGIGPEWLSLFALPPVSIALTGIARKYLSSEWHHFKDKTNARLSKVTDNLKMYTPFYGLGLGLAGTLIPAALFSSWTFPLAYLIFWGSFGTFFLSEAFGAAHSINTNGGALYSYKTSAIDLIGELEAKQLAGKSRILAINPHTGTHEHTLGLLFSILLSKKPGLSFVCMYDGIVQLKDAYGSFKDEKAFIKWVNTARNKIFTALFNGINRASPVTQQYQILIDNLEHLADYYEGNIRSDIVSTFSSNPKWIFGKNAAWQPSEVEEFYRGCFELLHVRAEEFRNKANKLRGILSLLSRSGNPNASGWREQLYREWEEELKDFDPDFVEITSIARKEIAGDEWKARKVENVGTIGMYRGVTVYKMWRSESPNQLTDVNSGYPVTEWVPGTWTKLPNPNFRYDAPAGTLEAAKNIWIKTEEVLTDLQKDYRQHLSTSSLVSEADNDPSLSTGFVKGTMPLNMNINREAKTIAEYYFNTTDQNATPKIATLVPRGAPAIALQDYSVATWDEPLLPELEPVVFTIPLFDDTLMMDKNDVEVRSYVVEPAILERERRRMVANIIYQYPFGENATFPNPHPEKEIDQTRGIEIVDANVEIVHEESGEVIPYQMDRAFLHQGRTNQGPEWQSATALIRRRDGSFAIKYSARINIAYSSENLNSQIDISSLLPFISGTELKTKANKEKIKGGGFLLIQYANGSSKAIEIEKAPDKNSPPSSPSIILGPAPQRHIFDPNASQFMRYISFDGYQYPDPSYNPSYTPGTTADPNKNPAIVGCTFVPQQFILSFETEIIDATGKKVKIPHSIPLMMDSETMGKTEKGIKNNYHAKYPKIDLDLDQVKITIKNDGTPTITLVYKGVFPDDITVELPPSAYPRFISSLPPLPDDRDVVLRLNNFTSNPNREGDAAWFRIPYTDGTVSFVRVPDGRRPFLFNKDRHRKARGK